MTLANSANRRPPGPDAPVLLGIDPETLDVLQSVRGRFGNIVAIRRPNGREALFVNDPAEIRRILVRQHARYLKGPGFERVKMLLGNGLIVSDGEIWRRSRTMIQPAFSRANLHQLIGVIVKCCEQRERKWSALARVGEPLNMTQETSDFALELILRAMFGDDYERQILSSGCNPFAFLSEQTARDLRVVMKVRDLHQLLLCIVEARRASGATETFDFLSIYLSARDKSGKGFSDAELLDELVTLIVAGYETSAGTLNWAWYLLSGNPDCSDRLAEEAQAHLADGEVISAADVAALHYTQALLEETLRLYPPVWLFTRRSCCADSLGNFDLAAGTDIYLSPFILHRTEEFWPEPERFDPARFDLRIATDSRGAGDLARKGECAYFPFSLGPRRCLGEYFAFLEMKIHLGILARTFRMTRIDETPPSLDLGINLRSKADIILRPHLRSRAAQGTNDIV
jgi:enediyne biosynthesis protein E7